MSDGLTDKERQLWWAFQAYLNQNKKETFTIDDLLNYFPEERLNDVFKDPIHDKGKFCFKLLKANEIRKVGEIYGRYNRSIKLYQTT